MWNVTAMDQYDCLEYELAVVVFCLLELVVPKGVILVRQDVRGLLHEWSDQELPLKIVAQCKFLEQCGSFFCAGSEQGAQEFYVTPRKANPAVVRQIWRAMSGRIEQCMMMSPLHTMLICHGYRDRLVANGQYHQSWWCPVNERNVVC